MTIAKIGWMPFRVRVAPGDYAPGALATTVPAALTHMRPAVVKEIIVNDHASAGSVEIHDVAQMTGGSGVPAATAAKAVINIANIPAGVSSETIPVDVECKAGFFLRVVGANVDVTVMFRPMGRTAPNHPDVFIQRR